MLDIIIIGGGPAGLSAAITGRQRNCSVAVISNDKANSGLYKAPTVDNYPGLPGVSGAELLEKLAAHAAGAGAELITGKVTTILPIGGTFNVGFGSDILASKSIIIATGVAQTSFFPGEEELLGRGVSYCATCDGMLFRGKRVCVVCLAEGAEEEAGYLETIGCDVVRVKTNEIRINGEKRVTSVVAGGEEISCDGVFVLRQAVALHLMLADIAMDGGHIKVSRSGETNIAGVFAAGDCTGKPHQIAKAVGEGQIAALSASEHIRD